MTKKKKKLEKFAWRGCKSQHHKAFPNEMKTGRSPDYLLGPFPASLGLLSV